MLFRFQPRSVPARPTAVLSRRWRLAAAVGVLLVGAGLAPGVEAQGQGQGQTVMPGIVVTMPPPPGAAQGKPPAQPAAQQPAGIPGLVISNPPAQQGAQPPQQIAPKPAAAAPKPKPKARPKVERTASAEPKIAGQGIVALVNDEPITAFEVEQRARFMSLSGNVGERAKENLKRLATPEAVEAKKKEIIEGAVKANQGKSREEIVAVIQERFKQYVISIQKQAVEQAKSSLVPQFRKQAFEELVEERLKLQEAKKGNITIADEDVERVIKGMADRNKMTIPQFSEHIGKMGGSITVLRSRFRSQMAWREVIRRKFGHQIAVSTRDVDQLVAASKAEGGESVDLQVHRILLPMVGRLDQAAMAARQAEADALKRRYSGCKSMAGLAKSIGGARFDDLGFKPATTIAEPTRTLLLAAKVGEMLPPSLTGAGVELYALCARRVQQVADTKRQKAQEELTMREFEIIAKRHLRDLRTDAHIEMR